MSSSFRLFEDDARRGHEAAVIESCLEHLMLFTGLVPCSFVQLADATTPKIQEVRWFGLRSFRFADLDERSF